MFDEFVIGVESTDTCGTTHRFFVELDLSYEFV
jgi:hypothetical protein